MSKIEFFVMDVDGTLTDGKIYMGAEGELLKAFDIKDGYGIHDMLIPAGITPVILTGRESSILANRCKELGIEHLYQNVSDKLSMLNTTMEQRHGNLDCVAYIGDDLNDLECMLAVKDAGGLIGCPADAVEKIKEHANFVSSKDGGNGAVREFIEYILQESE